MTDEIDVEAAFAALAERFAREPDVEFGTGCDSAPGLRTAPTSAQGWLWYESLLTSP
jgi:hypothetical protein